MKKILEMRGLLNRLFGSCLSCLKGNFSKQSNRTIQISVSVKQFPQTKRSVGLTLIEIIIVTALSGMLILGFVSFLFSLLKGGGKSEVIKEVKQNGDYAVFVMSEMIRNASSLTCDANQITIKNPDAGFTTFGCVEEIVDGVVVAKIASNSAALTGKNVTLGSSCPGSLSFSCDFPAASPPKITIQFTLSQSGTAIRPEERATSSFQTTISLRTY